MPVTTTEVVLLDVEGTTTPIDFVFKTLFPYARDRVGDFLRDNGADPDVAADVKRAWEERRSSSKSGPDWSDPESPEQAAAHFRWLIDQDVKSPALKSLQGKIWQQGYDDGSLAGEVYPDVPEAMTRWKEQGIRVAIYSSGSVLAQKLLFRTTAHGDLTKLIAAHFDTAVGPKREADSYRRIAGELAVNPAMVLFVSDIIPELDAALEAGMRTALSVRPGIAEPEGECPHPAIRTFHDL